MTMEQKQILEKLRDEPYLAGRKLGFKKLTPLHNTWIREMVFGTEDKTLQAHRGSYKTTCVSVSLFLLIILKPNLRIKFFRKTDTGVKEIIRQVSMMLKTAFAKQLVQELWNVDLKLTTDSAFEINTNLTNDPRGVSQLSASGFKASKTGQHYDVIFTDDIVTIEDRVSKAEREATKTSYYELQNIINPDGRIFNSGTPWHKEDAFTIMPKPVKYDCYQTGLMTDCDIQDKKETLPPSLFAANYELRHIAAEDVIFDNPVMHGDPAKLQHSNYCHIDAAYGGEDFTAFTIIKKTEGKYYVYGKLWQKHVDNCLSQIFFEKAKFNAGMIYCEENGDKGYLKKEIRRRGQQASSYWEDTNKYLKIVTYLKSEWRNIVFVEGTDQEYINQILDYNENAEHDDAPDSLASIVRKLWSRKNEEDRISGFGY